MKPEMFSVNVPIPDTIGLPGGKILRSFANVIMSFNLYCCFYTLLCARLLKVLGGPKRRMF